LLRDKALVVDGSGDGCLRTVCDDTHLNPVRAGLLGPGSRLLEYPGSSFGYYLGELTLRPKSDAAKMALAARLRRETTPPPLARLRNGCKWAAGRPRAARCTAGERPMINTLDSTTNGQNYGDPCYENMRLCGTEPSAPFTRASEVSHLPALYYGVPRMNAPLSLVPRK
jgi:hypothetical protein